MFECLRARACSVAILERSLMKQNMFVFTNSNIEKSRVSIRTCEDWHIFTPQHLICNHVNRLMQRRLSVVCMYKHSHTGAHARMFGLVCMTVCVCACQVRSQKRGQQLEVDLVRWPRSQLQVYEVPTFVMCSHKFKVSILLNRPASPSTSFSSSLPPFPTVRLPLSVSFSDRSRSGRGGQIGGFSGPA